MKNTTIYISDIDFPKSGNNMVTFKAHSDEPNINDSDATAVTTFFAYPFSNGSLFNITAEHPDNYTSYGAQNAHCFKKFILHSVPGYRVPISASEIVDGSPRITFYTAGGGTPVVRSYVFVNNDRAEFYLDTAGIVGTIYFVLRGVAL